MSRPSIGKRLGFTAVAVVGFFLLLEGGLRLAWAPEFDATKFTHATVYPRADASQDGPVLHKELGSNFHVTTDADGLRPPFHDSASGTRIVAMGCSTTYGWGVDDVELPRAGADDAHREPPGGAAEADSRDCRQVAALPSCRATSRPLVRTCRSSTADNPGTPASRA